MKTPSIRTLVLSSLVGVLVGTVQPSAAAEQLVGGYSEVSTTNAEVIAAAQFAVKALTDMPDKPVVVSLIEILSAQQQVVAGTNYRLRLRVRGDDLVRQVVVVVWRKLSGEYELTSWTWNEPEKQEDGDPKKLAGASALASDLPTIPATYKDYHFASDTNLPADIIRAMRSAETALQERHWKGDSQGVIYRVTKSGKGYAVSCLPYWVREDGQMGFLGGSSFFTVLDETFKVVSVQPGA